MRLPASKPSVIYGLADTSVSYYYITCQLSTPLPIDSSQPLRGVRLSPISYKCHEAAFLFLPVPILPTLFKEKYGKNSYLSTVTSLFP